MGGASSAEQLALGTDTGRMERIKQRVSWPWVDSKHDFVGGDEESRVKLPSPPRSAICEASPPVSSAPPQKRCLTLDP